MWSAPTAAVCTASRSFNACGRSVLPLDRQRCVRGRLKPVRRAVSQGRVTVAVDLLLRTSSGGQVKTTAEELPVVKTLMRDALARITRASINGSAKDA